VLDFAEIERRLVASTEVDVGAGATETEIHDAEQKLAVAIRGGFRFFLRRFGWGGAGADELYGLGRDVPRWLDLVRVTQSERTEMHPPLPAHLLPIMNNGAGDLVCLDTLAFQDEPPVVMWWHEDGPDQTPEKTAPDFCSWFSRILEGRAAAQ
jgi:hypothetical protein